jgi:glycerol-3-phosphate dehydrogenase
MFVLPWGDATLVGTTDTDTDTDPDALAADADDVTYLLRSTNAIFPAARLHQGDVISAWAGLRPLLASPAERAGAVPREHRVEESAAGLVTIAGGKLTTYRSMAADVVSVVARRLRRLDGRRVPSRARTNVVPLPGGEVRDLEQVARELAGEGVEERTAAHLVHRYGSEAASVANLIGGDPALGRPLIAGRPWIRAEVVFAARREMALSVSDVLSRRLGVFQHLPDQGLDAAADVARLLGRELGWSPEGEAASVAAYAAEVTAMRRSFRPA